MKSRNEYLPAFDLVVHVIEGPFDLDAMIAAKRAEVARQDTGPATCWLVDVRRATFPDIGELRAYSEFVVDNYAESLGRLAILTHDPTNTAAALLYEQYSTRAVHRDVAVFSTFEAAVAYLNLDPAECTPAALRIGA